MITIVTGPSGIGKTDCCFALLLARQPSVYLDSDWFSAKSPIDPFSQQNIAELYDLLRINISYHLSKGMRTFFVAIHQAAAARLPLHVGRLQELEPTIRTVILMADLSTMGNRISARDRIADQKTQELQRIEPELRQARQMADDRMFDVVIDTSGLTARQVADKILGCLSA